MCNDKDVCTWYVKQLHSYIQEGTSKGGGKQWQTTPQKLAQDAVCQSHTGHMTGALVPASPASKAEY